MNVTAIFDIGKTNKKFFLFDEDYQEVYKSYTQFDEIEDDDGYPCDDLEAIVQWVKEMLQKALQKKKITIQAVNFSTYGASLVHLDAKGQPLTPLYNYLKPYPEELQAKYYEKYGAADQIAAETASPQLGMLNSGMQLFWLKNYKPTVYRKIRWSLHFPQYLSYCLTGVPVSEFTSIGCHTGLWNFEAKDYHRWVYREGLDRILPPIVSTKTSINTEVYDTRMKVGVGIHDSSSALIPYLRADKKPFLLISTGTWSISLNPFNAEPLEKEDFTKDCLNFLQIGGTPTKAARLFLGHEYKFQINTLIDHFDLKPDAHKKIQFDQKIYDHLKSQNLHCYRYQDLTTPWQQPRTSKLNLFTTFEEAYHQLMIELVALQIESAELAIGDTSINKLYIDGGFAANDLYVKMLSLHFKDLKIRTTHSPLGSSLGAAMLLSSEKIGKKFLKKHYALKKV